MFISILDTDLYKFTQMNAVVKLYPNAFVRYSFFNRSGTKFPKDFALKLRREVFKMKDLFLTDVEADWLSENCSFFDRPFIDLLRSYRYNPHEVCITQNGGDISIEINGYWYRTILWEVPLMATISELFFEETHKNKNLYYPRKKDKATAFERIGIKLADFGTRRRFSYSNHWDVVESFKKYAPTSFVGTSNVHFALLNNTKPIGTQAHEWFMFHGAKFGFHRANSIALGRWVDVYNGNLGIALTDTYTSDNFFESFDTFYGKLYDGLRHDSGDPLEFGEKAIQCYRKLSIDPMSKTIVFSDSLNFEKVKKIENRFHGRIKTSYGIGTWLTNDLPDITPLNMVIKMTSVKINGSWIPTIKLSDDEGKHTGNKKMIKLAKEVLF